jgi:hypothetical protein
MGKTRKTVDVSVVVERVNAMLALPSENVLAILGDETPERAFRTGLAALLEGVLFDTGNYRGYNYQASEFLPAEEQTQDNVLRPDADDTRRRYYQ